ncbi:hypothetical protein, partial [Priestia megaterium]|uniref:hypothetical protein n=1 Tax=Priestia megaterium TaxID=1404 RepID=UPI0030001434
MENKNEDVILEKKEYLIDDPEFEHLKKDIKDMEKVISDAVPDISKMLEPVQQQLRSLYIDVPSIKVSLFTEEQQKLLASASKGLAAGINVPNMPKKFSLFTEEQQKLLASASKGLAAGINVPN